MKRALRTNGIYLMAAAMLTGAANGGAPVSQDAFRPETWFHLGKKSLTLLAR